MTNSSDLPTLRFEKLSLIACEATGDKIKEIISAIVESDLSRHQSNCLLKLLNRSTGVSMSELKKEIKLEAKKKKKKEEQRYNFNKAPMEIFIDIKAGEKSKSRLETIDNLEIMLEYYGISARYDLIKKKTEILIPNTSFSADNKDNCDIAFITSLAKLNQIPTSNLKSFVEFIAGKNEYNPVCDWIDSKEWDGKDRLERLSDSLSVKAGFPIDLRDILLRKWLISAIAAIYSPGSFRCRGVLTLQGNQSIGKTSWLLSLVDQKDLREQVIKSDHLLDPVNKDSVISALEHWIVELGELESSFKKDISRVKGFITAGTDKIRRPYAAKESEYRRRTVFFASVNDAEFLVDPTGNTRWWTIPVVNVHTDHGVDMQQLWAQVKKLFLSGVEWWLTREEEVWLESCNKQHRIVNSIREMVLEYCDSNDVAGAQWRKKSASEVLKLIGIENPRNNQSKDCGAALRELYGEPTMSNGCNKWSVPVKLFS